MTHGTLRETLSLPWLRVSVTAGSMEALDQVRRGARKFALSQGPQPFQLAARVELADAGGPAADAAEIREQANTRFQFVAGVTGRERSRFATSDGSVVTLDHCAGCVSLRLRRDVFTAPYSTWADLLAAPLAEHWRECGCYPVHAAAVDLDGWRPLIVGPSGSGKTTIALALVARGGSWRADDKVLVRMTNGSPLAVSLYRNTNLAPETIQRFEGLTFVLARPPIDDTNSKRSCFLDEIPRAVDLAPFAPTAILFLERGSKRASTLVPLGETEAVLGLAAQSPASGFGPRVAAQHRALCALASQLPAFCLTAGTGVLDDPASFAGWLASSVLNGPAMRGVPVESGSREGQPRPGEGTGA